MGKIEIGRLHFEIRKIDQERLDRQIRQKNIAMQNTYNMEFRLFPSSLCERSLGTKILSTATS